MKIGETICFVAASVLLAGCASTRVYVSGDDRNGHHVTVDRKPLIGYREFYVFDLRPRAREQGAVLAPDIAPLSVFRGSMEGQADRYSTDDLYGFVDYESSDHMSIQLLRKETAGSRVLHLQLPINGRFKVREGSPNQQIHPIAGKPGSG